MNNYTYYDDGSYRGTPKRKRPPLLTAVAVVLLAVLGGMGGGWLYSTYFLDNTPSEVVMQQAAAPATQKLEYSTPVEAVAASAGPAVVEISTESKATHPFFGSYVTSGAGSGVILSENGYIVTNDHVVAGADNLSVRTQAGDVYEAALIGTDSASDLAVVKIKASGLTAATFADSDGVVAGEVAIVIGNPLGTLGGTVSEGIISARERDITIDEEAMLLLQTTAAINPGNSGGGLFDSEGLLVGIVNAKSSGEGIEGIGFAIPSNTVKNVVVQLIESGVVTNRPSLGIEVTEITTVEGMIRSGVSRQGVYVKRSTVPELKKGDRLIRVNEVDIVTASDIKRALLRSQVGDVAKVVYERDGSRETQSVALIHQSP